MPQLSLHTPIGALSIAECDGALVAIDTGWSCEQDETTLLRRARGELQAYFDGELTDFTLPLAPAGTPYRQRVWQAMQSIAYGRTTTYAGLAGLAGGSARSVGAACGANPLLIMIPCHRVVGAAGLCGYSGGKGVDTKRFLLDLEAPEESVS